MSKADRDKRTNLRESVRTRDLKVEQDEVEKNKVKVNDYLIKKDTKKKSKKESKTTTKKDHDGDKAMEDKMDIYDSSSEDDERNKMDTDNTSIEENAKDKEDSKRKKKHKKKNKKDKRKHKKHSKKNKKDKKKKSKKSPKEDDAKVSKDSSKSPKPSDSETKKRQDQVEKALKKESDWQLIEPEQGFSKFDLDANIEICEKKIKDGIYPDVYRRQLKGLLKAKLDHEQILNQEPDPTLSTHVKLRLFELKLIEIELVKQKDPYQSLSNVRAIIKAYREHTLEWTPGKVTYWTHGTRINKEPEIFDFEDFEALNYALKGYKGFWVEGYHEVGPIDQQLRHISYSDVGPIWAFRNHVEYIVRLFWTPRDIAETRMDTRSTPPSQDSSPHERRRRRQRDARSDSIPRRGRNRLRSTSEAPWSTSEASPSLAPMPQTTSRAEEGYTSGFFPAMDSAADEDDTDRTDGAELLARMADESPPAEYLDLGLSEIMRRGVTEYEREVVGPTVEMEQSMPHRPRPRVLSASWNPDDSAGPLIDPPPEPDVRMEDDPGEAPDEPEEQDPAEPPHWRDDYADPPPFAAHPSRFRFDFLWDTGSQIMTLYQDDLASMMSVDGLGYVTWPWPQVMGYVVLRNSDGQLTVRLCIMLTVNMRDNTALYEENAPELGFEDSLMLDAGWLPVPCAIIEGNIWHNTGYLPRLSGPWPRHMLNVYSEASNTGKMWLEANPIFDPQTLQGPSLHPPIRYTAEYGLFGPRRGPTTSSHIGWEPQTAPPAEGGWHTQLEAGVNFTRMAMMRRMGNLGIPYNRLVEPHPPLPLTDEDPEAEQGPASPAGGQAGPPGPAPGPAPVGLPVPIPGPPAADIAPEGDTEAEAFEGQGAQGGQALRGPRGEPGPSGPRGPRGRRGEMGDLGPPGLRGIEGPPGPQGPLGLDGPRGPQGYPGPEGVRGWPGHDGAQGPPGEEGARGPPGEDGAEGPPGEEGARGPPGEQGIPGPVNIPPPVGGPAARCLRCRLLNRQFCWHFYSRSRR